MIHKLQEVLLLALAVLPADHMRLDGPPLRQLLELPGQLSTDAVAGLLAAAIKVRASVSTTESACTCHDSDSDFSSMYK
jgi:hypothetical protein